MRHLVIFNLTFLVVFAACVTMPEADRRQLILVPASQMEAMGNQAYAEMKQKETISSDPAMVQVVETVGRHIANASEETYEWEFTLFDAPETINAFCLPGGKVGIYSGILPLADNEAGLAAIMGHEVAHATLRHGAERVSQTLVVQMGVAVAALSFENENYRRIIAGALGIGLQFGYLLPYSRRHESEADIVGLKYMAKAGYDPREASELWKRMADAAEPRPPEFLSTHPDPRRRAAMLEKEAQKVLDLYRASDKQQSKKLNI